MGQAIGAQYLCKLNLQTISPEWKHRKGGRWGVVTQDRSHQRPEWHFLAVATLSPCRVGFWVVSFGPGRPRTTVTGVVLTCLRETASAKPSTYHAPCGNVLSCGYALLILSYCNALLNLSHVLFCHVAMRSLLDPIGSQYIRGFVTHIIYLYVWNISEPDITRYHWLISSSHLLNTIYHHNISR